MSTTDLALVLAVVSTAAAVIQTLVIVVSLLYVRSSLVQSNRQNQLNTLMTASSFYRKFNELELADPGLAAVMGDSRDDVIASIVLIDFEARKAIHDRVALDDPFWEGDVLAFVQDFQRPFLREHWKHAAHLYTKGFRDFVNNDIVPKADELRSSGSN